MAVYHNIATREHEDKRLSWSREQGEEFTVAIGAREVVKYTGRWAEVVAMAEDEAGKHPDAWSVSIEAERMGGDLGELTMTKQRFRQATEGDGAAEVGTLENPAYSCSFTVQADPLLLHPRYRASVSDEDAELLREVENGATLLSQVTYKGMVMTLKQALAKLSGAAAELRGYYLRGVFQYHEVYADATARWKGSAATFEVGQICVPPGNPATPSGRNWKCVGYGKETNGNDVIYNARFQLSGPGGWDEKLYGGE